MTAGRLPTTLFEHAEVWLTSSALFVPEIVDWDRSSAGTTRALDYYSGAMLESMFNTLTDKVLKARSLEKDITPIAYRNNMKEKLVRMTYQLCQEKSPAVNKGMVWSRILSLSELFEELGITI